MKISSEPKVAPHSLFAKIRSKWLSGLALTAILVIPSSLFASISPGQQAVLDALHTLYGSNAMLSAVTASQLESAVSLAVSNAIASNNPVGPSAIAAGALEPDPTNGQVRADISDIAPDVVLAAINALGNASGFNQRVANITAAVINVNAGNTAAALTMAGKTAAAGAALAAVPNAAVYIGIQSGQFILAKLAFTRDSLYNFVSTSGVNLSTAPYVAEAFVKGILSTGLPAPSSTSPYAFGTAEDFAAQAVSKIAAFPDVVARVGSAVASNQAISAGRQVFIAKALIDSAPTAAAKITQGVASTFPITPGEQSRATFAGILATQIPSQAQNIAVGMATLDPAAAEVFATTVAAYVTHFIPQTLAAVPDIAKAVVQVLPADQACEVGNALSGYIALTYVVANKQDIPFTSAPQIAAAIASVPKVVTDQDEMQEVASSMAFQLSVLYTPKTPAAFAGQLINAIANISAQVVLQNVQYVNSHSGAAFFGDQIAGSVAECFGPTIVKDAAARGYIFQQIINATNQLIDGSGSPNAAAEKQAVIAAVNSVNNGAFFPVGCIAGPETPTTNF